MAIPTPKGQAIEDILTKITGRSRIGSIQSNKCSFCGGDALQFNDELSRKEYTISGFCQKCQDGAFNGD